MSVFTKWIVICLSILGVFIGIKINSLLEIPALPNLENTWWGPGAAATNEDTTIKPFNISISDKVLEDLKKRLVQARPFTPPLEGIQQQYGMNTNLLKEIVEFWITKYNWREREIYLNKYPQFKTSIQGLDIHYLHAKPSKSAGLKVLPLMLLHGWPGSVREYYELIPLLTTPQKGRDFVFEVIVPSLPGYGFSQATSKPGLGVAQMAVVFKNFMKRLGFEKYYLQGGDWGAIVTSNMATMYPEHVLGIHSNICFVNTPLAHLKMLLGAICPSLIVEKKYEHRMYPVSKVFSYLMLEMGYFHLQATKPDTVGVALNDSPVGLAAYIIEKFTTWTNEEWKENSDGGLKLKYSYTDLLDNVMIYWVTGSITTSVRLYAESLSKEYLALEKVPIKVPSACVRFAHELAYQSDFILQDKYTQLVQSTDIEDGGHFAAFEVPQLLANEIWTAVEKFLKAHKNAE